MYITKVTSKSIVYQPGKFLYETVRELTTTLVNVNYVNNNTISNLDGKMKQNIKVKEKGRKDVQHEKTVR